MTPFEKARIRLKAFALLEGWGRAENPNAEKLIDRIPIPWGLTERMARAEELTKWAVGENHDEQRQPKAAGIDSQP